MEIKNRDEQQAWDAFVAAALSGAMVGAPTAWRAHVVSAIEAADALVAERRKRVEGLAEGPRMR